MSPRPPLVSVGLPVFNGQDYLADVLTSLLAQTFEDFELVISDNASTDSTESICREVAARDARVRYERLPTNIGAARNYNRVFELARGTRYFRWAAADDLYDPTHLRACVDGFASDGGDDDTVLVYPQTRIIDAHGASTRDHTDDLALVESAPTARLLHLLTKLHLCNPVFGLIRRDALASTGLIGSYVSSDEVLLAELALRGRFREVPGRLFLRRIHSGGSQYANTNPDQVAQWFDPRNRGRTSPRTRLFVEHCRGILRAPIALSDRIRCLNTLTRFWLPRHWRVMGGEMKRLLLPSSLVARTQNPHATRSPS